MGKEGIIVKLLIIMWYHSQQFPHMRGKKNNAHGPASGLQEKNYSFHSNGEGDTPQNNAEIVFVLLPLQSYLDVLLFDPVCVWVAYFLQTIRCCLIWISIEIKRIEMLHLNDIFHPLQHEWWWIQVCQMNSHLGSIPSLNPASKGRIKPVLPIH